MNLLYDETRRTHNNLNIIRLLLALIVIFAHSFPVITGDTRYEWGMLATRGQDNLGTLAVDAFFAISGFLITQSWLHSKSFSEYLKKRVLRIYPGFIVAIAFTDFVAIPLTYADPLNHLRDIVAHRLPNVVWHTLTLTLPWIPANLPHRDLSINNSVWTISYEFGCYLLVALLGSLGALTQTARPPRVLLTVFGLALLANAIQEIYILQHHLNADTFEGLAHGRQFPLIGKPDCWPRFAAHFLAGSVFYWYRERIPRSRRLFALCLITIIITGLSGWGLNLVLPLCGTYVVLYVGFLKKQVGNWITRRGDFSYGVYLYAFPMQQLLYRWFPTVFSSPYVLFALATLITLPLAILSWKFVEQPCLRFKPKSAFAPRDAPGTISGISQAGP